MTRMKIRIVASAAVFAANLALSLSYGTAEAQAPHHSASQIAHQRQVVFSDPSASAAEAAPTTMRDEMSMHSSDYSGFCGFSGVNAC